MGAYLIRYKKYFFIVFAALSVSFMLVLPILASSNLQDQITGQINAGAKTGGLGTPAKPQEVIASLVQVFLGLLGTLFLILILMSGYWLITARGNEQKHEKAMDTIRRAVIGFIVVMMAYGISLVVGNLVKSSVTQDSGQLNCGFYQRVIRRDNTRCAP